MQFGSLKVLEKCLNFVLWVCYEPWSQFIHLWTCHLRNGNVTLHLHSSWHSISFRSQWNASGQEFQIEGAVLLFVVWICPRTLSQFALSTDREFIEHRRRSLHRFLTLVARHPSISNEHILKYFLTYKGHVSHFLFTSLPSVLLPSLLRRCWLGCRKGIRPVKNWAVGCWHGYLSGARCRLSYGPADATATHCLFSKIQTGFTFLVPAHLGSLGQRGVKWVCVFCSHN